MIPPQALLAPSLPAASQRPGFVSNASFFQELLDIPTQILVNILPLCLGLCTLRFCGFFVKNGFSQRLGHVALRSFDCIVEGRLVRMGTLCWFRIVHQ